MTEKVEHTSSFPQYPFEPLEEETETLKQSRKVILEPRGQCTCFTLWDGLLGPGMWVRLFPVTLFRPMLASVHSAAKAEPFTPNTARAAFLHESSNLARIF